MLLGKYNPVAFLYSCLVLSISCITIFLLWQYTIYIFLLVEHESYSTIMIWGSVLQFQRGLIRWCRHKKLKLFIIKIQHLISPSFLIAWVSKAKMRQKARDQRQKVPYLDLFKGAIVCSVLFVKQDSIDKFDRSCDLFLVSWTKFTMCMAPIISLRKNWNEPGVRRWWVE